MEPARGRRVVVVGLARSGVAAARLLAGPGAERHGHRRASPPGRSPPRRPSCAAGVRLELGGHTRPQRSPPRRPHRASPRRAPEIPELQAARAGGVPRSSASSSWPAASPRTPIVGRHRHQRQDDDDHAPRRHPRGRRGPRRLRRRQPRHAARQRYAAGPAGGRPRRGRGLELPARDLRRASGPQVAVLLNVTPDHLDRYPSHGRLRRAPRAASSRPRARATSPSSTRTTPGRQLLRPAQGARASASRSSRAPLPGGLTWRAAMSPLAPASFPDRPGISRATTFRRSIPEAERSPQPGERAWLPSCAAPPWARPPRRRCRRLARAFRAAAAPHASWCASSRGVAYYDDSKGTNVDAVVRGPRGRRRRRWCSSPAAATRAAATRALAEALPRARVAVVVTIGEAAPLIERGAGRA